jgi:hypothetical protein
VPRISHFFVHFVHGKMGELGGTARRASPGVATRHAGVFPGPPAGNDWYENRVDRLAAEVVARTGYGKAVGVFDLGPRTEQISGTRGDRSPGEPVRVTENETGPLPHDLTTI